MSILWGGGEVQTFGARFWANFSVRKRSLARKVGGGEMMESWYDLLFARPHESFISPQRVNQGSSQTPSFFFHFPQESFGRIEEERKFHLLLLPLNEDWQFRSQDAVTQEGGEGRSSCHPPPPPKRPLFSHRVAFVFVAFVA